MSEIYRYEHTVKSNHFRIRPIGDTQAGAVGFREDLLDRWLEETIEDEESVVIGIGDYLDAFRGKIRNELEHTFAQDSSAHKQQDHLIDESLNKFAKKFMPLKGRILGLLEGHHYHKYLDGTTSTQKLCSLLDTRYLQWEAVIQIIARFNRGESGSRSGNSYCIDIFATHGCNGSKYIGTDLAYIERVIVPQYNANIYLKGHSTKCGTANTAPMWEATRPQHDGGVIKLKQKHRLMCNTGGFLEGRTPGTISYVEKAGLPSCALGWCVIDVWERSPSHGEQKRIEILGSSIIPQ